MSWRADNSEHVAFHIHSGVLCYLRPSSFISGRRKRCLTVFHSLCLLLVSRQWRSGQAPAVSISNYFGSSPHLLTFDDCWVFFFSSFRWKTFEVKCNQYFQQFPRTLNRLLSGKKHWNPSEMSMMDEVQNNCYRKGWLRRCHNSKGTRLISPQEHMQIGDWTYGTDDIQCPLRRPTVISVVLYFTVDLVMFVCVCVGGKVKFLQS